MREKQNVVIQFVVGKNKNDMSEQQYFESDGATKKNEHAITGENYDSGQPPSSSPLPNNLIKLIAVLLIFVIVLALVLACLLVDSESFKAFVELLISVLSKL